jgi:hypothetical protein
VPDSVDKKAIQRSLNTDLTLINTHKTGECGSQLLGRHPAKSCDLQTIEYGGGHNEHRGKKVLPN